MGLEADPEWGAGVEAFEVGGGEIGALLLEPVGEDGGGGAEERGFLGEGERVGGRGGEEFGRGEGGFEGGGGGNFGAEVGEGGGAGGVGLGEFFLDPGEIADGGVEEFAVEAPVAGAVLGSGGEVFLDEVGEVGVAADVELKLAEEAKGDGGLILKTGHWQKS